MNLISHTAGQPGICLKRYCLIFAGLLFSSHIATAQQWVPASSPSNPPFDAIIGGTNVFGTVYLCRGGQDLGYGKQLGYYSPYSGVNGCEIGFAGQEIVASNFEFLTSDWKTASNGNVPALGVSFGFGAEGLLYTCRASIFGFLQPGKIRAGFNGCYIPINGTEYHASQYEVLSWDIVDPYVEVPASNGYVPPDAIRGGTDFDGTPLYICAAKLNGSNHPGKLRQDFGACDISYGGTEHFMTAYTVLTMQWRPSANPGLLYPPFGTDVDGASLYICRANYFGLQIPGKTRDSFGNTCHVALNGAEQAISNYQVMNNTNRP